MSKAKILWVDDQIDLLKSHIIFLNEKGYQIDSCTNGSDALDKISNNRFDIILLDENMPGISGIETLINIKKIDRSIKVIMITKSEEENIMEEAIGKEISDYLIKPVNPNQILLSLKKTLQNEKLIKDSNISEYQQEFRNLSLKMMDISSYDEWIEFYLEIIDWELKLSDIDDDTMIEILNNQKIEANSLFSKFIERNYQSWFEKDNHPCLSHEILKKHLFPEISDDPLILIVIDNLRYDQWKIIEPSILSYYNKVKEVPYYSILPTSTQYARNSLFAGIMPMHIKQKFPQFWKDDHEEGGKNLFESKLLNINLNNLKSNNLKNEFFKITNFKNGVKLSNNLKQFRQNNLTTIVYNFVDMLSHSKTEMEMIKELAPNDKAYRSLTNSWFSNSPLFEIIKNASSLGFKLVITTDHGTINVKNPTKIIGDRNTSQNLRYKTGKSLTTNEKDNLVFKNPHDILLPKTSINSSFVFTKNEFYLVYPNNYNHFSNYFKNTYQHGGVSMEEMIIPFVILDPK
ncbi:MAG: two-component system response regulator [Flavobacteriaceae bacterium]|nr:two-component system response regulator [Flavobacteriaceae bacterium]OUV87652.1 MAG: two-component system response regulator [Flavobacteriaceae bacterium TMED145]